MPIWKATTKIADAVSGWSGATRRTPACRQVGKAVKAAPQAIMATMVATVEPLPARPIAAREVTITATAMRTVGRGQRSRVAPATPLPTTPAAP
jgi:prophage DNA circulation protein